MPRKASFICIGAQKTGTTWLYKVLKKHPEVWMPHGRKEVHYFDRDILFQPMEWYETLFDDPSGVSTVAGEKTPSYAHLKLQSLDFIRRLLPQVKIILILRRPDERAWSQARMEISDTNRRPLEQRDVKRCIFNLGQLRNSRLTRYDRMLANWREDFYPPEQLLVLFNEDIDNEPGAVIQRLTAFLGISDVTFCEEERLKARVWQSPDLEMPAAVRWYLQRRYRPMTQSLGREFSKATSSWLEPDPATMKVGFWSKLYVRLIADVATIPYNALYLCYDAIRDVRMALRLRRLTRQLALPKRVAAPSQTAP